MATEAAWLERKESIGRKEKYPGRKEKEKNILDSYRPSHGRMATEAAWLERKESIGRKEKEKNILDS
jgi:hypothetical protein